MQFKDYILLQELKQDYLTKTPLDAVQLPWKDIFGDKLRIKLDYVPDYSFLNSNEVVYVKDKKAFFKSKDQRQKNKIKLSKAVSSREEEDEKIIKAHRIDQSKNFKKLLDTHPDESKALLFHMRIPIPIILAEIKEEGFYRTFFSSYTSSKTEIKEILDYLIDTEWQENLSGMPTWAGKRDYWWVPDQEYADRVKDYSLIKNSSEKYSIILSRSPIDVLRASDYANIITCMSPAGRGKEEDGPHYGDLRETCLAGAGIAYILPETIISDSDLQNNEVFKDVERKVEGLSPIARLLLRQFKNDAGQEIMIPEVRVHGSLAKNMKGVVYDEVAKIIKNIQGIVEPLDHKNWYMRGSKYIDTEITEDELISRFNEV